MLHARNNVRVDIDQLISRKSARLALDHATSFPHGTVSGRRSKWIRVPFLGKISFQLQCSLWPYSFYLAFYNPLLLKRLLPQLKDRIPKFDRSGVYGLSCNDCSCVYVGETWRPFKIRISEHFDAWQRSSLGESTFADHLIRSNHHFDPNRNVTILHSGINDLRKRLALEQFEIVQHLKNENVTLLNKFVPEDGFIFSLYNRFNHQSWLIVSASSISYFIGVTVLVVLALLMVCWPKMHLANNL